MTTKNDPIAHLLAFQANGTLAEIGKAAEDRTPVRIKRSSGKWQNALIAVTHSYGGAACVVCWNDDCGLDAIEIDLDFGADRVRFTPKGTLSKMIGTADLVEWNPALFPQD